jgi:putative phosphotransacetylase
MEQKAFRTKVEHTLLTELAKTGEYFVPVSFSNRHIHLSRLDKIRLFGADYELKKIRDLIQPGQYACAEQVILGTPKGPMPLRVVGPVREETQIEILFSDAVRYGLRAVVRVSGDTADSPGCVIWNGNRLVTLTRGLIVAARHLHMSGPQAEAYGLQNGDLVSMYAEGPRETVFRNVVVRAGEGCELEAHIDTDESGCAGLREGAICRIEKQTGKTPSESAACPAKREPAPEPPAPSPESAGPVTGGLITEADVRAAKTAGLRAIRCGKGTVVTPLARDLAWEAGIDLRSEQ